MTVLRFLYVLAILKCCTCVSNETSGYLRMDRSFFKQKSHRFFTFSTQDSDQIAIELAFNVPFVTVPIKKTFDNAKDALANLNMKGLALTVILITGILFVIPAVYHLVQKQMFYRDNIENDLKQDLKNQTNELLMNVTEKVNRAFDEYNFDSASCTQHFCCWAVKNSALKVSQGTATSRDKIIDGIATNEWFRMMVKDTMFHPAIEHGLKGSNCSKEYPNCIINQWSLNRFIEMFISRFYV